MRPIQISDDLLVRLASRPAEHQALRILGKGQLSKCMLLISYIARSPGGSALEAAVRVLSDVQWQAPDVADQILTAPCVSSWAGHCARRLQGSVATALPLCVELSYLNAVAVVAAMRAGLDARLDLYVRDGVVLLPTLGAAAVGVPELSAVRAQVSRGRLTLLTEAGDLTPPEDLRRETSGWMPMRTIRAEANGQTISLTVDDLDYYRDCYGKTVATRLSDHDYSQLVSLTERAWALLVAQAPSRASELATGLRSMVPLSSVVAGPGLSATSATAYGAFAFTVPEAPEHLGATLVHEFQHSKLSALLDLLALYDKTVTDRYFAPWKPEPRPFGGLLQGAYAFLSVADYWCTLYQAGHGPAAERYFAEHRVQVDSVIDTLQKAPHLTAAGRIFVDHMRASMDRLLEIPVGRTLDEAAHRDLQRTYESWLERNTIRQFEPDPP